MLTHADKHKIPELRYDVQAHKRRLLYHSWFTRLLPIIKMFPQTSPVYSDNNIVPFTDPSCIGNQALFLLLSARVDNFYRNLIRPFDPHGDMALQKLLSYCANITTTDATHYDHLFTTLRLSDHETVTHFLKNFTIAKTRAEVAGNEYSDQRAIK